MDASNVSWFEADWSRDELEASWRQLEQLETPQTLSLSIKRLTKLRNIHLKRTNIKKCIYDLVESSYNRDLMINGDDGFESGLENMTAVTQQERVIRVVFGFNAMPSSSSTSVPWCKKMRMEDYLRPSLDVSRVII